MDNEMNTTVNANLTTGTVVKTVGGLWMMGVVVGIFGFVVVAMLALSAA